MSEPIRLEETAADVVVRTKDRLRDFAEKLESQNYELVSKAELAALRADAERWRWCERNSLILEQTWRKSPDDFSFKQAVDAAIAAEKGAGDA